MKQELIQQRIFYNALILSPNRQTIYTVQSEFNCKRIKILDTFPSNPTAINHSTRLRHQITSCLHFIAILFCEIFQNQFQFVKNVPENRANKLLANLFTHQAREEFMKGSPKCINHNLVHKSRERDPK